MSPWPPGSSPPPGSECRCACCGARAAELVAVDEGYLCLPCARSLCHRCHCWPLTTHVVAVDGGGAARVCAGCLRPDEQRDVGHEPTEPGEVHVPDRWRES